MWGDMEKHLARTERSSQVEARSSGLSLGQSICMCICWVVGSGGQRWGRHWDNPSLLSQLPVQPVPGGTDPSVLLESFFAATWVSLNGDRRGPH